MALFSLKDVQFKDIVHYPDLDIPEGQTVFICGESGCGKSTLLKLLNGVISADGGEILYAQKPITDYDPIALRREVLLCGQSAFLFDASIWENVTRFYQYRDLPLIKAEVFQSHLNMCAADFSPETLCTNMSGGERQRIYLAICLSFHPKVLLLDEPTSALDDVTAHMLMANVKAHSKEHDMNLIVVSHHKALAEAHADHVITLD